MIESGALTHGSPLVDDAAIYLTTRLSASVSRIGASARFSGRPGDGVVAFVVSAAPIPADETGSTPNAAVHFVADAEGWTYAVWNAGDSGQDVLASGRYRAPISLRDARFQVSLAGDRATVTLPDETMVTIRDPRIQEYRGRLATWELFEASTGAQPAALVSIWAA